MSLPNFEGCGRSEGGHGIVQQPFGRPKTGRDSSGHECPPVLHMYTFLKKISHPLLTVHHVRQRSKLLLPNIGEFGAQSSSLGSRSLKSSSPFSSLPNGTNSRWRSPVFRPRPLGPPSPWPPLGAPPSPPPPPSEARPPPRRWPGAPGVWLLPGRAGLACNIHSLRIHSSAKVKL